MSVSAAQARSVALLDRAVDYTGGSLVLVPGAHLDAATPCARWSLRALLEHMDDSLAAFTEAAEIGYVDLSPIRRLPTADRLIGSLELRACALRGAWSARVTSAPIGVGDAALGRGTLAVVGALEISVHGWDVAWACGADRPLPDELAIDLYDLALDLVTSADRPEPFGSALAVEDDADPSTRLLAYLGRRAR